MMLIGTWTVALDRGGRLALPPPFRAIVSDGMTVTRGFDRCLQVFPNDAWYTLARRVSDLPLTAADARSFRRLIFGAAADLALDRSGALTLPRSLLTYAELSGHAVLVGCDTYFEIWSPERWNLTSDGHPALDQLAGLVAGLTATSTPAAL